MRKGCLPGSIIRVWKISYGLHKFIRNTKLTGISTFRKNDVLVVSLTTDRKNDVPVVSLTTDRKNDVLVVSLTTDRKNDVLVVSLATKLSAYK
jgi:hypothetical protein